MNTETDVAPVKLGPRMAKVVRNKLANTLITFRYSCPELAKVEERLLTYARDPEEEYISELPIPTIVKCLKAHSQNCLIAKKLYENIVRDIALRAKHYRTWNKDNLYLTEVYVESFNHYKQEIHSKAATAKQVTGVLPGLN